MSNLKGTRLTDRGVVRVSGDTAERFLGDLVTGRVSTLQPGQAGFAALLTPQGKILFDFLIHRRADAFLLDCRTGMAGELVKRLTFYKLRAKVDLADVSQDIAVAALWGAAPGALPEGAAADPRHQRLGWRAVVGEANAALAAAEAAPATLEDYHAHRISCAVPEGGLDFAFGEAFPHEADMDKLSGIAFDKGCFIGQEVVSRMENRGTARTRIVPATYAGKAPEPGTEVTAGGKVIGATGSAARGHLLAMLRIDRLNTAIKAGQPVMAGHTDLNVHQPDFASFAFEVVEGPFSL